MPRYRASWVLPIVDRPIRDGWVEIDHRRITAVGETGPEQSRSPAARSAEREIDLGHAAILPGLVNAHTHLELSALRGRVPRAPALPAWVCDLLARRAEPNANEPEAIVEAIDELRRTGTVLVGDISNTLASFEPLLNSPVAAVVFREIIGFNPVDSDALVRQAANAVAGLGSTDRVRATLAAHAPYSVATSVFTAIRRELDRRPELPMSVHLGESRDEIEFLRSGTGQWRRLLEHLGAWEPSWEPPQCSPVAFLDRVGWLDDRVIVVHGVQLERADLAELAHREVTLVTCPRSNAWTGAGAAPVARFYAAGIRVAVGTDSLASVPDLRMFEELAAMRRLAPEVPGAVILESATLHGARALGFGDDYGSIEPGKSGELIAVGVPEDVDDVEEYLVRGIESPEIRWLDTDG